MNTDTPKRLARYKSRTLVAALAAGLLAPVAQAGTLEVLVLDRDGKPVPDAVVIVQPSTRGTPKKALPLSATINQEKMQFVPNVSVVGVGAKVRFTNWKARPRANPPVPPY